MCLPDPLVFVYSFRQYDESEGSLKRNERQYKTKAEKQQKGDILQNSVAECHNVFCFQFCHVCGKGAVAPTDR